MDRSMIDAGSSGALMDKTPATMRNMISNMFGTRGAARSRGVNEAVAMDSQRLENKITELTSLEVEPDNVEVVGLIGGHQYGGKPYGSWQYDVEPTDSRVVFDPEIWFYTKHASKLELLPTIGSQIPSTTFSTTAITTSSTTEQFTGGADEAVDYKQH
ncbi:hypothetical protein CR513_04196, partial [Mucuna pruriens]